MLKLKATQLLIALVVLASGVAAAPVASADSPSPAGVVRRHYPGWDSGAPPPPAPSPSFVSSTPYGQPPVGQPPAGQPPAGQPSFPVGYPVGSSGGAYDYSPGYYDGYDQGGYDGTYDGGYYDDDGSYNAFYAVQGDEEGPYFDDPTPTSVVFVDATPLSTPPAALRRRYYPDGQNGAPFGSGSGSGYGQYGGPPGGMPGGYPGGGGGPGYNGGGGGYGYNGDWDDDCDCDDDYYGDDWYDDDC